MEIRRKRLATAAVSDSSPRQRLRVTLPIAGLTCGGGGALTVERALVEVPGVIRAYVNPATEMAYVEYDPRQTSLTELNKAVESAGYRTALPGGESR